MRARLLLLLLLAGCATGSEAAAPGPTTATTEVHEPRLSTANRAALDALVAAEPASFDPAHLEHDVAGHDVWGPVAEPPLDPATAATLEAQWDEAVTAAAGLATPDDAMAAGYQRAAAELPGIGSHFVRWDLIDQPFDPARPSMLLYDESALRPARLVGFSYWLRSEGEAPEGFAGDGDHWHMHHGLCFRDGLLMGEDILDPADCRGDWLAGTDLWMGHAWINPDLPNRWGRFAPRNPDVCPADSEPVADYNRCPNPLPVSDTAPVLDANALYCVLPQPS